MHVHSIFFPIICLAVAFLGLPQVTNAKSTDGTVFAVDVERVDGEKSAGSAILLTTEEKDGQMIGWFCTCFHVVHNAKQFSVGLINDNQAVDVFDSTKSSLHVRPKADIVIVRAPISEAARKLVSPLFPNGIGNQPEQMYYKWAPGKNIEGTAYGYSFLDRKTNVPIAVKIWGHEEFGELYGPNGKQIVTDYETVYNRKERLASATFLGNEITLPGMSGGLVITNEKQARFAGMVFARVAGLQGLAVSSETVVDTLIEAKRKNGTEKFTAKLVSVKLPFNTDVQATQWKSYEESQVVWESFDQWDLAFRNDKQQAATFERFQEIRLDLQGVDLGKSEMLIKPLSTQERDQRDRYEFILNGEQVKTGSRLNLHPGENLLVINKKFDRGKLEVNDFLIGKNKLDVWIAEKIDGKTKDRMRLVRSLPGVIKSYSVFVTIVANGTAPSSKNFEWPRHIKAEDQVTGRIWTGFGKLPGNVIKLVTNASLNWQFRETDLRTGSTISGSVAFDELEKSQLRRISSQTFDLQIPLRIKVDDLRLRYLGVRLERGKKQKPINLNLTTRFQLNTNSQSEPTISVRALSASATGSLTIPLFGGDADGFGLDVGSLLSHLAVAYLNHQVFKPTDEDRSSDLDFLIALGGVRDKGWHRIFPALLGFTNDKEFGETSLEVKKLDVNVDPSNKITANFAIDAFVDNANFPKVVLKNCGLSLVGNLDSKREENFVIGTLKINKKGSKATIENIALAFEKGALSFAVDSKFESPRLKTKNIKAGLDILFPRHKK